VLTVPLVADIGLGDSTRSSGMPHFEHRGELVAGTTTRSGTGLPVEAERLEKFDTVVAKLWIPSFGEEVFLAADRFDHESTGLLLGHVGQTAIGDRWVSAFAQ
jgi:hypothetical protein